MTEAQYKARRAELTAELSAAVALLAEGEQAAWNIAIDDSELFRRRRAVDAFRAELRALDEARAINIESRGDSTFFPTRLSKLL